MPNHHIGLTLYRLSMAKHTKTVDHVVTITEQVRNPAAIRQGLQPRI